MQLRSNVTAVLLAGLLAFSAGACNNMQGDADTGVEVGDDVDDQIDTGDGSDVGDDGGPGADLGDAEEPIEEVDE